MNTPIAIDDIPWKWLSEAIWREKTFKNQANFKALAEDGFVYIKSQNKLMCWYCHIFMSLSDNVQQDHCNLSPECPIVKNNSSLSTSLNVNISIPPSQLTTSTTSSLMAAHSAAIDVIDSNDILQTDHINMSQPVTEPGNHLNSLLFALDETEIEPSQRKNKQQNRLAPSYSELGIITERPRRNDYATQTERNRTFVNWPRNHPIKIEDLVNAGFYHAGVGDCTRCFYCGGGLRNWEDNDDVYVEHARWFPKCGFIRQLMGHMFIETVQELVKTEQVISYDMVMEKLKSMPSNGQDSKCLQDAAVRAVIDEGYNAVDVLQAADFLRQNKNNISADEIIDYLTKNVDSESQSSENYYPSDFVKDICKDVEQIKRQNVDLRQQTLCKICLEKEVAMVFLPCGHFVACVECSHPLKHCPLCRNLIRGTVRAFLS